MIDQEIFLKKVAMIYALNPVLVYGNCIKFIDGGMFHIVSFWGAWPGETPPEYVFMQIEHRVWPKDHQYVIKNNFLMLLTGDGSTYFEQICADGSSGNVELELKNFYPKKDRVKDKYSLLSPHNRIDGKILFDKMNLMIVRMI